MLTELHIENIAVIERADIEFGAGLNVLTGETGAGKSIIIDSLGAVLGARTSHELVRTGADKGLVTAVFDTDIADGWLSENEIERDGELILQRRINADGKTSCRVCGAPVSAAQLRALGSLLLDIHGQNDGRRLMDEARHGTFLDRFGVLSGPLSSFSEKYEAYIDLKKELKKLDLDEAEKERLTLILRAEVAELEAAGITPGEEAEKSARRDLLRNSEKLTEALDTAYDTLYAGDFNAAAFVDSALGMLSRAREFSEQIDAAYKTLDGVSAELNDAVERIRDVRGTLDFSPREYDELETRLAELRRLERKYSTDEAGLAARLEKSRERLSDIEFSEGKAELLRRDIAAQGELCRKAAEELTAARKAAAGELEARITRELEALSMPSVHFRVEILPLEGEPGFDRTGADVIRFLMSANAGEEPGRISRIASGGELSRIMLAMKNVFAERDEVPTLVFDEIDAGVSGIAAQRVGEKLSELSGTKQVLCVTHLAQIAAMADEHFMIEKTVSGERTYTRVNPLKEDGRIRELARLHGGDNITETTLKSAGEQLGAAEGYKARLRRQKERAP